MRPKRLISLLVAVCMMITMLPLSAVTAFAADTAAPTGTAIVNGCEYDYKINTADGTATITKFRAPDDHGSYDITIPTAFGRFPVTDIGDYAFSGCHSLTTLSLGENIKTIGSYAFYDCTQITGSVTIPQSVTSIGPCAFAYCTSLKNITIPEKVKTIEPYTFGWCTSLKYITLPAGLTSFKDRLVSCPAGFTKQSPKNGAIYYNNDKTAAERLRDNPDDQSESYHILANRNFLYLCKVTFDARGGKTDYPEVPVYKTEKITDTKANDLTAIPNPTRTGYNFTGWYTDTDYKQLFNADETITKDITLYARWEPVYHPLTVTGGTATVEKDGQSLNIDPVVTGNKKTYDVPEGAKVTVKLDKNTVPEGKVFDGWSTSLPTGQDYKAESITFPMSSGVDIAAQYRDAAADHTPDTAVCHPLTVTGGTVTVKNGDKDVTDTLTVTTDETTGKKTYSVPDGATVTVTLDKTLIPEGMVFDIWSTGKFSLPLGQDYKAESITFPMSSGVDIAAQYRDATIEDDGPGVLGTVAIIGTAAVGGAVLGYQAYSLGAEFAGKLMALPYFPSNRSALAMMLWEDAGKPMPESELLYPDVGQEEQDMDLQHAARWAMENELIPDLNDEGTAPEEMKFFPANPVSKLDVLNAWQKAQELKNN
ncbi:leucine-rich repeat protein [Faecalibacterium prausnitzii]|uniref:Leucine-rich repeat protein n=1 Tax=Faecalibacterium prausnitzii TaxID=853 RepID=A0A844DVL8_9FIRM|nr:leucine-rich repeat protein [Faecalibacterium prausnitzii]MSC63268.1 leucine-rich repeat protein [Faecalibacterium prausnitzii]